MNMSLTWCIRTLGISLLLCGAGAPNQVQAQDNQHVVSLDELNKDSGQPAETRQTNEAAVRQLFSSETAQKALKSAKVDYAQVDKAIGQLSDEDLAKLAERSQQVQSNFAAGRAGSLSDRDLLIIIIIAVLVIALVAVLH
jgi:hypothetical protein